ncbi:MAG: TonB-dependent receptor [Flavobacteriales bacterium]|nr:TonB-dependent receptor [Flavobacteriales bacterium]
MRVIDERRLKALAANDLSDALRNELNIRLSQDNILGSSVSMQGLSGANVKVLVDGVPVIGRLDGDLDLAQIGLNGIARIEVVEGPLSVSYGSNALAGTINLITKRNAGSAPTVKFSAYAEQIGRLNLWGTFAQRWGRHHLNVNLGRDFFNGWNPTDQGIPDLGPSPADTTRFQQWKPREQYTGRINYRWNGARWQLGYKGEYADDVITNRGMPREPYRETAFDERYHTVRLDNALFADRFWEDGRKLTLLAAHNRYTRTRNTWLRDLTSLDGELVPSESMQDTSFFTLSNVRAVYASAGDSARLRYELGTDLNYETGSGGRIEAGDQVIGDYALYTSLEYRPVEKLTLRPALRYAYNTVYGAPLLPSLNLRWQLAKSVVARASFAQGFRAPSLKELYLFFVDVNHNVQGNTELRAERSNNYSLSFTWTNARERGAWRAEISGFYNDVQDLITLAQVDASLYTYTNIGTYHTAGGTAGLGWEDARWSFTAGGNLTGRSDDLAQQQQQKYLWAHEARASAQYTWAKGGLTAQVFYKYQGEVANYITWSDGSVGRGAIAAYSMADASVTKSLWKERLGITLGCKNLFDVKNVTTTASDEGGAHASGGSSVPMMTGRIWFVGLNVELTGGKER